MAPDDIAAPEPRPRPLKPYRKTVRYQHLPIITVASGEFWREDTGETGDDMGELLLAPRSLIVVDDSAQWAASTHSLADGHDEYDYSVRIFETACFNVPESAGGDFTFVQELCFEWGLRPKFTGTRNNHHWHMVLDPSMLVGVSNQIQFLEKGYDDYYRLASEFRDWCKGRNIPISLTKGSAAARILRGLVTEAQCKVPFATNENCRRALGANLLRADTHGRLHVDVTEFDQKSAQHLVARDMPMPDRNEFFAHGDFNEQKQTMFYPGSSMFTLFTSQQERGVLLVTVKDWLEKPYRKQYPWSPYMPWIKEPMWVTTNELSLLKRCGVVITGIIAAWTSDFRSYELRQHANTSLSELAKADDFTKAWLKPVNLAVYGATAMTSLPAARRTFRGEEHRRNPNERITNHTAWLAMIQREVRKRSVMFAMDLEEIGVTVMGIYVDAVYAKVGNHGIGGYVPTYFVERSKGIFGGKNGVKVFGDKTTFPGMPLSDPDRTAKARAYMATNL